MRSFLAIIFVGLASMASINADEPSRIVRVGFIGLDSSHCIAFTELLQREGNTGGLAGVKIVAAYPGGNPEFPLSRDRVQGYTEKMRSLGVQIVDSIDGLFPLVDAIILAAWMAVSTWLRSNLSSRLASQCLSTNRWLTIWRML